MKLLISGLWSEFKSALGKVFVYKQLFRKCLFISGKSIWLPTTLVGSSADDLNIYCPLWMQFIKCVWYNKPVFFCRSVGSVSTFISCSYT